MAGSRETPPSKNPDGGYGWVVTGAAFASLAILHGLRCSFSLLYVEFSHVFDENKATLGWIGSLNIAMCFIIGRLDIHVIKYLQKNKLLERMWYSHDLGYKYISGTFLINFCLFLQTK